MYRYLAKYAKDLLEALKAKGLQQQGVEQLGTSRLWASTPHYRILQRGRGPSQSTYWLLATMLG